VILKKFILEYVRQKIQFHFENKLENFKLQKSFKLRNKILSMI